MKIEIGASGLFNLSPPVTTLIYCNRCHSLISIRAVARSENQGGHIVLGGDNVFPLIEIGLTDLSKSGGARAPPACDRPEYYGNRGCGVFKGGVQN